MPLPVLLVVVDDSLWISWIFMITTSDLALQTSCECECLPKMPLADVESCVQATRSVDLQQRIRRMIHEVKNQIRIQAYGPNVMCDETAPPTDR